MLNIGEFEIALINDATVWMDGGGAFGLVPRKLWSHYVTPTADHLIPMSQNCLLVRAYGKTIVVDTGLGEKLDERTRRFWSVEQLGGLRRGLAHYGVTPEQVDLVINTHLHGDHAGGNTRWAGAEAVAVFPQAEYVVQRREYADACQPNERTRATYLAENFAPLLAAGQMRLLDGDTELLPGLTVLVTPGHTPGHMSVRFNSAGQHAAFVCDLASLAVHFEKLAWMTAYDVEPLVTLETKRAWQQWALATQAVLIFPHDRARPVGRLIERDGKVTLEALDEPLLEV